jgi:transcription-repair coupling factor (superfamily II helicase)
VEINLPLRAYIPDAFVGDMRLKIDLYRRLSRVSTDEELSEFFRELQDRFGSLPPAGRGIAAPGGNPSRSRLLADQCTIYMEEHLLGFHYANRERLLALGQQSRRAFRFVDDQTAYLPLPDENSTPRSLCLRKIGVAAFVNACL